MVYMYHSFLIHSSADGHLGCFHVLAIINSAAGNYKQGEKTALRLGENNSKRSNRQRINLRNIQATPAAQFQKNK